MTTQQPQLLRISELARQSGVSTATIKHYLRVGLLPGPDKKTGRTMAYYHPALVTRVQAIRELQQQRYLPLSVIREVLDGADPYDDDATAAALKQALARAAPEQQRTRKQLIASGMPAAQLDFFEAVGFVTPEGEGDERRYLGDDLVLLRTLAAARREGLSPEMLPHTIVAPYLEAIESLVRVELAMFREGLKKRDAERSVDELVDAAFKLSERLVVVLRRKRMLPVLQELADDEREEEHS
jgi:DNA-binding transcriptional MerR regulator